MSKTKYSTPELNKSYHGRVPIVCKSCGKSRHNFGFGLCSSCLRKYKRQTRPNFYLGTCYSEIKRRCTLTTHNSSKRYIGRKFCSREEFLNKFLTDDTFLKLFKGWQDSNFKRGMAPSIDRIDNDGDYTLDNMQFITQYENSKKDVFRLPIEIFEIYLIPLGVFESLNDAGRKLNLDTATLSKASRTRLPKYKVKRVA